jgi:hypothetical protein
VGLKRRSASVWLGDGVRDGAECSVVYYSGNQIPRKATTTVP